MRSLARVVVTALAVPVLLSGAAPAVASSGHVRHGVVRVGGAVDAPASLSRADLAALPQTTLTEQRPGRRAHELTGVLMQTVVDDAEPRLPDAKNAALRVSATVSGRHHDGVAVARGELDPGFGNHPALLVLARDGRAVRGAPDLVFPGDSDGHRTVNDVSSITVAVAATATATVAAGAVLVTTRRGDVTLSAAELAALPQQTRTVSYLAAGGAQSRTETGPTLRDVLRAARVRVTKETVVAASATDGYVAAVTPGEATSGGRTLLLSLVEDGTALTRPRLVPDGDVRGGRYVSEVTVLAVSGAGRHHR